MSYSFGNCIFTVSGQLPPPLPRKIAPPVRVGVWVKVGLVLGLGDNSGAIALEPFFTFVLLNEVVPDVETTYFVLIEQKKENCLQIAPGVSVITKDEMICSANK